MKQRRQTHGDRVQAGARQEGSARGVTLTGTVPPWGDDRAPGLGSAVSAVSATDCAVRHG